MESGLRIIACCLLLTAVAYGQQLDYTGGLYQQNFDGLPASGSFSLAGKGPVSLASPTVNASGLAGWQIWMPAGSGANAGFAVSTGSSTGSSIQSLGAAASSDRALGSLSSGSGTYAFGLILTNRTGQLLNYFTLSFTIEQWRKGGSGNPNTWTFRYKTGAFDAIDQAGTSTQPELNLHSIVSTTGAGSLNGNLADNRATVSYTVTGIRWKPGEQLLLRWDDADESGNDDACALDDLGFTAGLAAAPPTITTLAPSAITPVSATLHAKLNDGFAKTTTRFIIDTTENFSNPDTIVAVPFEIAEGTGDTTVFAIASSLATGKTYYYFPSAANSMGTVNGAVLSFTTQPATPTIHGSILSVTGRMATISSSILSDGGSPVHEKGVIWSLTDTVDADAFIVPISDTSASFTTTIGGLPVGDTVFIWSYAANTAGTGYSNRLTVFIAPDTISPFIQNVQLPENRTYISGDTLTFRLVFTERVFVTGAAGAVSFSMTVGTRSRPLQYVSGSASDTLLFRYIVQNGDSDKDGIRINSPLVIQQGAIRDSAGNTATLAYNFPSTADIRIDAVVAVITSVKTPAAGSYRNGSSLEFTVNYSRKISVMPGDALPLLPLDIGGKNQTASYVEGLGGTSLLFRYVLQDGDIDKDGIKLGTALLLPGAVLKDEAGNTASLQLSNIGALSSVLVNPPVIVVDSVVMPAGGWYAAGDTLWFTVITNEPARVELEGGIPSLKFTLGSTQRQALYNAGSGTQELQFAYAVVTGDLDTNGIKMNATLSLNNGAIKDLRGNSIPLSLIHPGNTDSILIDAADPVTKALLTPPKGDYSETDTLNFQLTFNEPVSVIGLTDTPFFRIQVNDTWKRVTYQRQVNSSTLLFQYPVAPGDLDRNGIRADTLLVNSHPIRDAAGNSASPVIKNIGALSAVHIDAVAPAFANDSSDAPVCAEGAVALQELLAVNDTENDEPVTWKQLSGPAHGKLSVEIFSRNSNGKTIVPDKWTYAPLPGFTGRDTVHFEMTDGIHRATKAIFITVFPPIENNLAGSDQTVCSNQQPVTLEASTPYGGNGIFRYTWEASTKTDTSGFVKLSSATERILQPGKTSIDTWLRRIVISGDCVNTSAPLRIIVRKEGIWTGEYDQDWNNPNNWCGGIVPGSSTTVLVDGYCRNAPVIADSGRCNRVVIPDGLTLTVTGTLQLTGDLDGLPGRLDARQGSIMLCGNSKQSIAADAFTGNIVKECIINNPGSVRLNGILKVSGNLQLNKGTLYVRDTLQLLPNAVIGACGDDTRIDGLVSVSKILNVIPGSAVMLGHPFSHPIALSVLADSLPIYGPGGIANGFKPSANNTPSAFFYDYPAGNDSTGFTAGWKPFTDTRLSPLNEWKATQGIRVLIEPNEFPKPSTVSIVATGRVTTGTQLITLPQTGQSAYHVIANPYPAPIDLAKLVTGSGLSRTIWVWNRAEGKKGVYTAIPAGTRYLLPSFGSFVVRTTGSGDNTILFTENMKQVSDSLQPVYTGFTTPFIALQLLNDGTSCDRLLVLGTDRSYYGTDEDDGEKIMNENTNLYALSGAKRLSIDARQLNNNTRIPLGIQTDTTGEFRIRVSDAYLQPGTALMLHDAHSRKWMKLEKDSVYSFLVTNDTGSYGDHRFEISAYRPYPDTVAHIRLTAVAAPNPVTDIIRLSFQALEAKAATVKLYTLTGLLLKQWRYTPAREAQMLLQVADVSPGLYLLELTVGEERLTRKIIKR